ncbi:unnamed protein product [Dovyalis caffra]|uniref:C2 domain-containing protein n=1 Tax=Dovyalis caffra TaxID=77055 RepID=A0AAV1RLB5_9ROSI|nr:unnamed protein product [Dovyalis caffra]
MEGISLELKVISCRDLKTFNFFQKLSVYVVVSIFIDEPKKNEQPRQKTAVDFLNGVLKKNVKQQQRLQGQKTSLNVFNDEAKKDEQQQLLQRQKTPVDREGGSNPEWNHMMQFDLNTTSLPDQGDNLFFKFELRCEGAIFGNRTIGEVCVPFKDLSEEFNGSVRFVSYQVRNSDGRPNGVLNFSYEVIEKVKKKGIDSPKVDLPRGIPFSSVKKLIILPWKSMLMKACYPTPPPAFPYQLPPSVAVGHGVYQHQYPSPLTQNPGSDWYSTKTTEYGCGTCGYPGGWGS